MSVFSLLVVDCNILLITFEFDHTASGGMGDEDETQPDDNLVWMKYFLKPVDSAQKVVCTRKANGEAAHLSVRYVFISMHCAMLP